MLRKLAKPVTAIGLTGFLGQFLLICCCIGSANAAEIEATKTDTPVSSTPAEHSHCHEAKDKSTPSAETGDRTQIITSKQQHPCLGLQDGSQSGDNCCEVEVGDVTANSIELALIEHQKFESDQFDVLLAPISLWPSTITRLSIPPDPKIKHAYKLTPAYLANCAFLE